MGSSVLRWAPTAAVLVGLLGLLVVGWQYSEYVSVFGDDPCRSRGFCDERAIALARRELSGWYLGSAALAVVGLVVTTLRRSWRGRQPSSSEPGFGAARHTGLAVLLTLAWLGWLVATFAFWLFGGAPLVLAFAACWLVGLGWALDRLHRRAVPGEATGVTLLVSAASTVTAGALALSTFALVYLLGGKGGLLLPPVAVLVGVAVVVAVARVPGPGPVLTVPTAVLAVGVCAVGVCAVVMVTFDAGRDAVRALRDEFHPEVPAASAAPPGPLPPVEPAPRPPGVPTPTPTTPDTPVVKAARPCGSDDLTLQATGWDSAMGTTAVTIVAANQSGSACWVEGYPSVRLLQGGVDLHLQVGTPTTSAYGEPLRSQRVGVAPGGEAVFGWWWKGYRTAADQSTPQTVVLDLGRGTPLRLELPGAPYLLDVVDGAAVDVTPWGPRVD